MQAGFAVSSKNFKKSVDRNRIKRLTLETYRLKKNELAELLAVNSTKLAVFFIYTGKELPEYKIIEEKMTAIVTRLIATVNEHDTKNT